MLVQASGPAELQVLWQNLKEASNSGARANLTAQGVWKKKNLRALRADCALPAHWQDSGRRSGAKAAHQGSCLNVEMKFSPQTVMRIQARFYFVCFESGGSKPARLCVSSRFSGQGTVVSFHVCSC